ncbi:hypothetical protein [Pseudonocardia sp.]|uniref:hypothetical protein n=1 Tax=Pseudonocardia sp. TaxID=60912 RepID=UPI003D0BCC34
MFKSTCPSKSYDNDKWDGGYGGKNDKWDNDKWENDKWGGYGGGKDKWNDCDDKYGKYDDCDSDKYGKCDDYDGDKYGKCDDWSYSS